VSAKMALGFIITWMLGEMVSQVCLLRVIVDSSYTILQICESYFMVWKCRFFMHPKSLPQVGEERCVFLCNHRSFADFLIDTYITRGAFYLSRLLVILAIPVAALLGWLLGSIVFFKRVRGTDKTALYNKCLQKLETNNLLVYPEGTRNTGPTSKPLTYGMIRFAYKNNIPVQIVMTTNKERVMNEKKLTVERGVKCVVNIGKVIRCQDSPDIDHWCKKIAAEWDRHWEETNAPITTQELAKLKEMDRPSLARPGWETRLPTVRKWVLATVLASVACNSAIPKSVGMSLNDVPAI